MGKRQTILKNCEESGRNRGRIHLERRVVRTNIRVQKKMTLEIIRNNRGKKRTSRGIQHSWRKLYMQMRFKWTIYERMVNKIKEVEKAKHG